MGALKRSDWLRWALASTLVLTLPWAGPMWHPGWFGVLPEAGVLLLVLLGLRFLGPPPRRRWPSWRAWLVAAPWMVWLVFESARTAVRYSTNEDLPLYDAVLLSRHLYVLGRDLYGVWATVLLVVIVLSPLPLTALGAALFGEVERTYRLAPPRVALALAAAPAALAFLGVLLPRGHWSTPPLVANASRSWALYRSVATELAVRSHDDLDALELRTKPDVVFYVVESYGRVVATDPAYAEQWAPAVDTLDRELTEAGWTTASAWAVAPVHGGRSWIADASLLLGLEINHQSEYEHVLSLTHRLPSLRTFFERQGYVTVLIKPTDRERPGVKIENPFGFERTVFHDDLGYEGPIYGWGQIPDQYTIDFVQEKVLDPIAEPRFAFFHLATCHLPWTPAPPIVDHWSKFRHVPGSDKPMFATRTIESEIAMRVSRFKRRSDGRIKVREGQHENYLADVLYDLEVIGDRLAGGPTRPTLVVVMGDHQPPLLADKAGDDVPVHVLASDPALLQGLLGAGFEPGLRPTAEQASIGHHDLFPLVAKTLAVP